MDVAMWFLVKDPKVLEISWWMPPTTFRVDTSSMCSLRASGSLVDFARLWEMVVLTMNLLLHLKSHSCFVYMYIYIYIYIFGCFVWFPLIIRIVWPDNTIKVWGPGLRIGGSSRCDFDGSDFDGNRYKTRKFPYKPCWTKKRGIGCIYDVYVGDEILIYPSTLGMTPGKLRWEWTVKTFEDACPIQNGDLPLSC